MKVLIRKKKSHWLYEWSPNGKNWYPINERNVIADTLKDRGLLMNRVIEGETILVEACYVRSSGTLAVSTPFAE